MKDDTELKVRMRGADKKAKTRMRKMAKMGFLDSEADRCSGSAQVRIELANLRSMSGTKRWKSDVLQIWRSRTSDGPTGVAPSVSLGWIGNEQLDDPPGSMWRLEEETKDG